MKRGTLYIICAVNRVDAIENGNLQASLLRRLLNLADDLAPLINRQGLTVYVEDRADSILDDCFVQFGWFDMDILILTGGDHGDL